VHENGGDTVLRQVTKTAFRWRRASITLRRKARETSPHKLTRPKNERKENQFAYYNENEGFTGREGDDRLDETKGEKEVMVLPFFSLN
jgi:hypothetical protein